MFSLFTLHASGHNPRPGRKERVRQRFMHKLSYFPDRYDGVVSCVGCGRCVIYCPVNIDIREISRLMAEVGGISCMNPYTKYPVSLHAVANETADKNMKTFELHFEHEDEADSFFEEPGFKPGQFAMLWLPGAGEIPLGVASSPTERDKLLFTVNRIGKVTRQLHELPCGSMLGVRGPLGNGFPWQELQHKNIALIGGGYAFTTLRSSLVYMLEPAHRASLWQHSSVLRCPEPRHAAV